MPGDAPTLSKNELFARLAQGHAAGVTVVTPNRRLAQVLRVEFDFFQQSKQLTVWDDADILPVGAFAQRLYEDALYAEGGGELPVLLAPAQERALWESALGDAPLLSISQTAAHCADAWRLAHAWRIAGVAFSEPVKFNGNDDTQAFAGWARAYAKHKFVDTARLPDLSFEIRKPKLLVAYGFDLLPPQTRDFLGGFEVMSCHATRKKSVAIKTKYASARHELEAAAQWARARLEAGAAVGKLPCIGVVVPDLQLRRREVARVFSGALRPGWNVPGTAAAAMPFDISIGEPLGGYALVDCALTLLELSFRDVDFETASRLVRSPFLGGAEQELAARARLDARMRKQAGKQVSLPKLISLVEGCAVLRERLEFFYAVKEKISLKGQSSSQSPQEWARHFTALLDAARFPGERVPDSVEFQVRVKFNELLGEFSRLSLLSTKMSAHDALRQLRRICADTLFQPETPEAPIQVAGILESAGLEFDCLWVCGLTEDAWPLKARPNPFLPVALQKKAGIPEAAAETSLALDRRITAGWLGAALEVVFSYPEKEKDRDLLPSPLIAEVPPGAVEGGKFSSWRSLIFQSRQIETIPDGKAQPLREKTVRGGTRVLADQAACPFRAFARHRLGAEGLESPEEGLDAMQRGQLLHSLMAGIWRELKTREGLDGDVSAVISKAAKNAVKELKIEGQFAELETRRLIRLAGEWLEVERARKPFEVVHIEEKRTLEAGGLAFSGRIDRMDRLLEGEMRGTHAIIDYKTGRATKSSWLGERPDEPQLPLYAVSAPENVSVVAFARLQPGAMKYAGFSAKEKQIPGVTAAKSWSGLLQYWKTEIESLASGFAQGEAPVDPKDGFATCRYCDLQPLCRVHERLSSLEDAGPGEDDS